MTTRYDLEILIRTKKEGDGIPKVENEVKGLGDTLGKLAKFGLVAGAGKFLLDIGRDAITTASDIQEMQSMFDQVFGPHAGSVTNQLKEFGDTANRSIYDLQGFAAGFQDTFVPLGFARERAAELSVELTKLTEDLASFKNIDAGEAAEKLSSGLVGNHEALRSFGIVITETVLKAELAANGWDKLSGAALEQAKVQARLNIIMRSTTDAQGDAIRTADSYANQVRGLEAAQKELYATIGTLLLPVATDVVSVMAEGARVIANDMTPSVQALTGEYGTAVEQMIQSNLELATSQEEVVAQTLKMANSLEIASHGWGLLTGTADDIEASLQQVVAGFVDTSRAGNTVASQNRAVFESLQAVYGEAVTMERGYIKLNGVTVDYAGNLFDLALQLQLEADAAEAASFDNHQMNRTMEQSAEAAKQAVAAIRPYHQAMAEARGPNEDLADKQAQLANRITETEAAIRAANAANQAFVEGLRAQEEAAIAANAALVGAFQHKDTADAIQSLLAGQDALAASQGEWVTAVRDSSGQVADINSQLAADLSSEQKRAYEDILNTVAEGSAEWLAAYQALQGDLTDSQRAELVAQRAELEAAGEQIVNVYTGDAAAAKEAQEQIEAANAALIESYRNLAVEGSLALAELSPDPTAVQRTLDYAVAIGAMTQAEADMRLEAANTRLAIEDLNAMVVQNGLDAAIAGEAFRLLTEGEARTAEEAVVAAEQLVKMNEELDRIPGSYEAEIAADTDDAMAKLDSAKNALDEINGRTVRAYVEIEERIQSSQQDQSVVGSGGNGGGGRAGGGPVSAGRTYRVGEGNRPELLSTDNGLFMIPGDNGRVFSNQESQSLLGNNAAGPTNLSITVNVETVGDPDRVGNLVARGVMDAARQLGLAT